MELSRLLACSPFCVLCPMSGFGSALQTSDCPPAQVTITGMNRRFFSSVELTFLSIPFKLTTTTHSQIAALEKNSLPHGLLALGVGFLHCPHASSPDCRFVSPCSVLLLSRNLLQTMKCSWCARLNLCNRSSKELVNPSTRELHNFS